MAILVIFWSFVGDRMANLSLIDFKLGLYMKKFEVHIAKHLVKMAINWHKIGQMPHLGKNIK